MIWAGFCIAVGFGLAYLALAIVCGVIGWIVSFFE